MKPDIEKRASLPYFIDVYQHLHHEFRIGDEATAKRVVEHFTGDERALLLKSLTERLHADGRERGDADPGSLLAIPKRYSSSGEHSNINDGLKVNIFVHFWAFFINPERFTSRKLSLADFREISLVF